MLGLVLLIVVLLVLVGCGPKCTSTERFTLISEGNPFASIGADQKISKTCEECLSSATFDACEDDFVNPVISKSERMACPRNNVEKIANSCK